MENQNRDREMNKWAAMMLLREWHADDEYEFKELAQRVTHYYCHP